jgi:tetratricopeptide (TPR) repeat protein
MSERDYYHILEVSPDASPDEIKKQYHFLLQAWHPDKFSVPDQKAKALEKAKVINEAYAILRDPDRRAKYDRERTGTNTHWRQSPQEERHPHEKAESERRRAEYERQQREKADAESRRVEYERQQQVRAETQRRRAEYERQQREKADAESRRVEYERQQQVKADAERQRAEYERQRPPPIVPPSPAHPPSAPAPSHREGNTAAMYIIGLLLFCVFLIVYTAGSNSPSQKATTLTPELVVTQLPAAMPTANNQVKVDSTKTIEVDPNSAATYFSRGYAYYNQGTLDQAIANYAKAIELDPKYADAYNSRGVAYFDQGEYDLAIADYTKAIELNPKDAYYYNNRGNSYGAKGNLDQAITELAKAIELDPNDDIAYRNRGFAYREKGLKTEAAADFNSYLRLVPNASDRTQVEQWLRELN